MILDTESVLRVPIAQVRPNPDNPRKDVGDLTELAASIAARGVLVPCLVVEDDGYLLLDGERRWRAAQQLGVAQLPVVVHPHLSPAEQLTIMLTTAVQRADLAPTEEARAFKRLADYGLSQQQIAEKIGCDQSRISRRLRLLELPDDLQAKVDKKVVPASRALATLEPKRTRERKPRKPAPEPTPLRPDARRPPLQEPLGFMVVELNESGVAWTDDQFYPTTAALAEAVLKARVAGLTPQPVVVFPLDTTLPEPEGDELATVTALRPVDETSQMLVVTIGEPTGMLNTRDVICPVHGRLTKAKELDFAVEKAERHIESHHGGVGEVGREEG